MAIVHDIAEAHGELKLLSISSAFYLSNAL